MPKNAALKPAPSARVGVVKKPAPMTAVQRRKKIAALCDDVATFWKGKQNTGALAHLLNERHGKA